METAVAAVPNPPLKMENLFKVDNNDTGRMSVTSFWCPYCQQ